MKQQEEFRKQNDYEDIMRKALIQSQQESMRLHQKGLIQHNIIESTPDGILEEVRQTGSIDLNFFNELNGF